MFRKQLPALLSSCLMLAACQTDNWGGGETVGTFGGAAAGGLIGSQIGRGNAAATLTGVLLGAFAGNQLGGSIDDADRRRATAAEQRAYTAPIGQQITWSNPQSGNNGTIIPVHDDYANTGAYCREFAQTITVEGQQQQATGHACQQPDGTWKIVP